MIVFYGVQKSYSKVIISVSFSVEKIYSPVLTVFRLSHLTSCKPTNSNLYLANFLVTVINKLTYTGSLHSMYQFSCPFYCLGRAKRSIQARGTCILMITRTVLGRGIVSPRPTPKVEAQTLSALRDCLFNIYMQLPSSMEVVPPFAT
jgi:hypothetical protein